MFRAFFREIGRERLKCAGTRADVAAQIKQASLGTFDLQYAPPRKRVTFWRFADTKSVDNVSSAIHTYKAITDPLGKNFLLKNYHVMHLSWANFLRYGHKGFQHKDDKRNSFPSSSLAFLFSLFGSSFCLKICYIFFKNRDRSINMLLYNFS